MWFWILAFALAALTGLAVARPLLRARPDDDGLTAAQSDIAVYRDQLAEVDRDRARGVLTDAEAEAVRLEVSRRLLDADRKAAAAARTGRAPAGAARAGAVLVALLAVAGTGAVYWLTGAPGYPDLPLAERIRMSDDQRASRPSQAEEEARAVAARPAPEPDAETAALMARLREAAGSRPDDLTGQRLLADYEARLGNFAAARAAQDRVLALLGDAATVDDRVALLDLSVMAAGGAVSPEAEAQISAILAEDAANGTALYYLGLQELQLDRPDRGFRIWRTLLEDSDPGAPWLRPIRAQIADVAARAGVRYTPPEAPSAAPGPSDADIAAAGDMTEAERTEMIRGMVEGLAGRLAEQGGPAEDWARLIGALGVLGETDRARAIADEAVEVFADDAAALDLIRDARDRAGIGG